jgi:DNA-binding Xre family transcriptional regulator
VITNNIANLLRARQGKKEGEHLDISQFAKGAEISRSTAHDLVYAKSTMFTLYLLNKLCKYFKVGPGELLVYIPDPEE